MPKYNDDIVRVEIIIAYVTNASDEFIIVFFANVPSLEQKKNPLSYFCNTLCI